MRKPSFGDPEADPWGSPDLHRGHHHAAAPNDSAASAPARTTSPFTTHSTTPPSTTHAPVAPMAPSSLGSEGGWGGFGAPLPPPANPMLGSATGSSVEEVVTVTALPEKEGMFMFQHRNYQVASSRRTTQVVRRYSDFVWLLDCLHKRYPFRQLPLLPPKRVASTS